MKPGVQCFRADFGSGRVHLFLHSWSQSAERVRAGS